MYGYSLYLVTVFRVIVWTRVWNLFWNFGSWGKFSKGKGLMNIETWSFFKVLTFLKISKIWFKELWMYGYSVYLVTMFRVIVWTRVRKKCFEFQVLGGSLLGEKGWWTLRLGHFSRFLRFWKFQTFDLKRFECMDILYNWSQCLGW